MTPRHRQMSGSEQEETKHFLKVRFGTRPRPYRAECSCGWKASMTDSTYDEARKQGRIHKYGRKADSFHPAPTPPEATS